MTYHQLKEQFNTSLVETGSYMTMAQRLDDARYARWEGQSEDGRKYSKNYGRQVFPWEGASDQRIYTVDDLVNDDVDLMLTASRNAHMQVVGTAGSNDETARAVTSVLDYIQRMWLGEELERERDLAANWRAHYGSSVIGIDWLIELDAEQVTVGMQQLMMLGQQDPEFGAMLQYVMQNMQAGNAQFSQDDQQAFAQKFAQYFPEADPMQALSQLMQTGSFSFNRPYVRTDRPCVTAYRTFQDVFFFRSIGDLQKAPWVVRRDVLPITGVEDRAKVEGWDPDFTDYIIKSAGSSWMWSSFSRGESLSRFGTRLYTDELDKMCEIYYGFYRGTDQEAPPGGREDPTRKQQQQPEAGNRQTKVVIFHPGTDKIGRQLPLPYAHGQYPFILCRRENRSRSAYESRGIGDIADCAQAELKTQRDARNDRTSFAVIPPLMVPLGRGKQQYRLGPAAQLGVMRPGELSWLAPPPLDQTTYETESSIKRDIFSYFGKNFDGVDPNKVLRKQQRLINSWLDEQRAVMNQVYKLCLQFLPLEKWQQISGQPDLQLPIGQREFVQDSMMLILEFDARDLNMEFLEQKLNLINTMIVPSDAAGVIDRAGLTQYAMRSLDPSGARLIRPQGQATQQEITEEQAALGQIVTGVTPPIPGGSANPQLRLQVIQSTLQAPDFIQFLKANPIAQQRLQERIKSFQFAMQQQQNAQVGRIGVPPSPVQSLAPSGPPAGAGSGG
jgi:hypothetical protein